MQDLIQPTFIDNIYACSIYGDVQKRNKLYYTDGNTANQIARRFGAIPVLSLTSPNTGPALGGPWNVCQIPKGSPLLPPEGARQYDPTKIMLLMHLPPFQMWVLAFPNGTIVNAGFLADYYTRNPENLFPNLADWYVYNVLRSSGAL